MMIFILQDFNRAEIGEISFSHFFLQNLFLGFPTVWKRIKYFECNTKLFETFMYFWTTKNILCSPLEYTLQANYWTLENKIGPFRPKKM